MAILTEHNRKAYRNEKLSARFYFYDTLMGLKSELIFPMLVREFDLAEATIYQLLQENTEYLSYFDRKGFTVSDLKKRYPFMSWQYRHNTTFQNAEQLSLSLS